MVIALDSDMENKDAGLQVETSGESYLDDKLEEKHSKESKPMVLVVEDNPEMLTFIERQLSFKYAMITATNGKEALEVLNSNFINLVVSDVVMPLMDGFELCKTIKSNVGYSHIPIIL